MTFKDFIPKFTEVKNEVVFYLIAIAGVAQWAVVQLDSLSFNDVADWYGVAAVGMGLVQRVNAYGKQSVIKLLEVARAEASGQTG